MLDEYAGIIQLLLVAAGVVIALTKFRSVTEIALVRSSATLDKLGNRIDEFGNALIDLKIELVEHRASVLERLARLEEERRQQ
jgi:hypothetical protein